MTADPHCASAEMMSVLAALYPGHRLVDGTFPQLALSFRNGAGIALDLGGPEGAAQAFYGRFRQRGGHAPVLSPGGLLAFLRAEDTSAATVFAAPPAMKGAPGSGAAMVESFRGDVFIDVRLDGDGRVARLHARDPSCFQWPLLEAAIEGNIVADFPLCNKSFNCSYSGHDL